jgi:hypothetical protein
LNAVNTNMKYYEYRYYIRLIPVLNTINTIKFVILLLCYISQIATGVPCSEYPRTIMQYGPILITIRRNLTCFRPGQSLDVLGRCKISSINRRDNTNQFKQHFNICENVITDGSHQMLQHRVTSYFVQMLSFDGF